MWQTEFFLCCHFFHTFLDIYAKIMCFVSIAEKQSDSKERKCLHARAQEEQTDRQRDG